MTTDWALARKRYRKLWRLSAVWASYALTTQEWQRLRGRVGEEETLPQQTYAQQNAGFKLHKGDTKLEITDIPPELAASLAMALFRSEGVDSTSLLSVSDEEELQLRKALAITNKNLAQLTVEQARAASAPGAAIDIENRIAAESARKKNIEDKLDALLST